MTLRRAERESMKILQFRTPKIVSDLMLVRVHLKRPPGVQQKKPKLAQ